MLGMLIASCIAHMLFDTKQGDIQVRDIDDIMKSQFMAIVHFKFDGADALDGTCSGAITECHMIMWARIWLQRKEQVLVVAHMPVGTAIDNELVVGWRRI